MTQYGLPDVRAAAVQIMKQQLKKAVKITRWNDRWVLRPWPIAAEPSKYVCWLTDDGDYDEDHVARLHLLATLHPIDRFFMQTRRRVSRAERAVVSVRQQRRMWNGYGAYNPRSCNGISRFTGRITTTVLPERTATPPMRIGLAKSLQKPQALLNFR